MGLSLQGVNLMSKLLHLFPISNCDSSPCYGRHMSPPLQGASFKIPPGGGGVFEDRLSCCMPCADTSVRFCLHMCACLCVWFMLCVCET